MSQFVFSSYAPKHAVAGVKYVNVNFHSPNGSVKTIPYAFTGKQELAYGKLLMNQN